MADRGAIRVLVVDDHKLFRIGLTMALRSLGFSAIDEAGDGDEALRVLRQHAFDVVLLDLRMPKLDGLRVAAAIGEFDRTLHQPYLILLSTYNEPAIGQEAERLGVSAVLGKEVEPDRLASIIDALVDGRSVRRVVGDSERVPDLTPREMDVLRGLASGSSVSGIAADLGVGTETVKAHVSNLYGKLGVHDRVSAVMEGRRLGWLVLDEMRSGGDVASS